MKTLKQVELITGIKSDNLRQRIHRGTLKATKIGRDWAVSKQEIDRLLSTKPAVPRLEKTSNKE